MIESEHPRVYAVRDHTFMDGVAVYVWPGLGLVWKQVNIEAEKIAPGARADAFVHLPLDIAEKMHEALGEALGDPEPIELWGKGPAEPVPGLEAEWGRGRYRAMQGQALGTLAALAAADANSRGEAYPVTDQDAWRSVLRCVGQLYTRMGKARLTAARDRLTVRGVWRYDLRRAEGVHA